MWRTALSALLAVVAISSVARAEPPARSPWTFALYLDAYAHTGESEQLFVPTVFADRAPLHLEARYNYEGPHSASVFVGWIFELGGERDYARVTPMLGGVFGPTAGVAPGLEIDARFWRLAYWLEAEYLVDTRDVSASYFYTWSELDFLALPWLWFGVSAERLRVLDTPRSLSVGPAIGVGSREGVSLSVYAYGLATGAPWYLATLAAQF